MVNGFVIYQLMSRELKVILISLFAVCMLLSIIGLLFSIFGFKSQLNKGKAKAGLILNTLVFVIPWLVFLFLLVISHKLIPVPGIL